MRCFKYQADRPAVFWITLLFVLDLLAYFYLDNIWLLLIWMIIGLAPKACICSWNHHHQHVPTFHQTILNRGLELIYALQTGITTNAWVLHHVLGHHVNYLDQKEDESGWQRADGSTMGVLEYTLTIALTGYGRAYKVGQKHPRYQKTFLSMGLLVLLALAALLYFNWINALIIFALPMAAGLLVTSWHTYYHHAGLDTKHHTEASYNIMHKWYNILTGNLGYHTAHHMKQGLHWSKLPQYHAEIASEIPTSLYRQPCWPFTLLPEK